MEHAVYATDPPFGCFARIIEIVMVGLCSERPIDGSEKPIKIQNAQIV